MKLKIGDHIKALKGSRHVGYTGTVIVTGQYLVIKCDEDNLNPQAWSSKCYGEGKFFCLDENYAAQIRPS